MRPTKNQQLIQFAVARPPFFERAREAFINRCEILLLSVTIRGENRGYAAINIGVEPIGHY